MLNSLMIDPRILREEPESVKAAVNRKGLPVDWEALAELDSQRRSLLGKVESLRSEQKAANQAMAALDKKSDAFRAKVGEMKAISLKVKEGESALKELEIRWEELLLSVPNMPHSSVPDGRTPEDNQVFSTWGNPDEAGGAGVAHWEIPGMEKYLDFARGAKVSGAGFPFYMGNMASLVRGLVSFFLSEARENGYLEIHAPLLVNADSPRCTGQLPDKDGQMYHTPTDDLYLIPTAEVPVTNLYRDEILSADQLPLKHAGYTPCFRREAGSYGKDVRGLNRLHQFDKVELVKWVAPETSYDELESLRDHAEGILKKLGLPYRVLLLCTGDMGFSQAKVYDLEVWSSGQKRWLEVSSCSNFESFQARRGNIRFRRDHQSKPEVVHTLNGSGLAVPRVLAALLENGYDGQGTIHLPEALHGFCGFKELTVGQG